MADIKSLLVYKEGEFVGEGMFPRVIRIDDIKDFPPFWIFYTPIFKPSRFVTTRHFQKAPLNLFFDWSSVAWKGEHGPDSEERVLEGKGDEPFKTVENVRYLFGKSRAILGQTDINSIFLLYGEDSVTSDSIFIPNMFDIYKKSSLSI